MALPPSFWAAGRNVLSVKAPAPISVNKGETAELSLRAVLDIGYHVNSNTPSGEYLIPLKLTWIADPLKVTGITYPKPEMETYSFTDKPLSVFTGDFDIVTRFEVPAGAASGELKITGKLRYQACSDKLCLPPKTIPVEATIRIQ